MCTALNQFAIYSLVAVPTCFLELFKSMILVNCLNIHSGPTFSSEMFRSSRSYFCTLSTHLAIYAVANDFLLKICSNSFWPVFTTSMVRIRNLLKDRIAALIAKSSPTVVEASPVDLLKRFDKPYSQALLRQRERTINAWEMESKSTLVTSLSAPFTEAVQSNLESHTVEPDVMLVFPCIWGGLLMEAKHSSLSFLPCSSAST